MSDPFDTLEAMTPEEGAAYWRVRLERPEAGFADERDFEAWKDASPDNRAAADDLEDILGAYASNAGAPEAHAMREAVLSETAPRRRRAAALLLPLAATIVIAVVGVLTLGAPVLRSLGEAGPTGDIIAGDTGAYETALGERSTIALPDGSTLTLNTASRAEIDFSGPNRNVRLTSGQAWFEVAKDPSRPFVVAAGGRRITALGTAFDVRVERDSLAVTLAEGRVSVTPEIETENDSAELVPGEQFVAQGVAAPVIRVADVAKLTSWREGWIVFEDERLADALAEVNRYGAEKIVLGDAALENLPVSATFRTGRTDNVVEALTKFYDLQATSLDDRTILLLPK